MKRRDLHFSSLEDVISDLQKLLSNGYSKTGQWALSQMQSSNRSNDLRR